MGAAITDPATLAELNAPAQPITDTATLAELNAPAATTASAAIHQSGFDDWVNQKGMFWDAMRQIGSQPSMQPINSLNPIPEATGDPTKDVLNSAKSIAEFPFRLSQTMGKLSEPTENMVVEHLGKLGLPAPISAALAMAAGMAVDPRNWALAGSDPLVKKEDVPGIPPVGGKATVARAAQAEKFGINLTPAQASQNKMLGFMEAVGNRYPYTADDFTNFYKGELEQADNIRATLIGTIGNTKSAQIVSDMMKTHIDDYLSNATPEQASVLQDEFGDIGAYMKKPMAGEFTKSMLAQQRKIALDQAGAQFESLRGIVPDETPIKTPTFAAKAKELLDQELQANPSDRNAGWVKRLSSYAGAQNVPGLDLSESVTGNDMGKLQTAIQKAMGQSEANQPFGGTQMTMRKLRDLRIANDPGYLLGIKGQGNTYAGYAAQLRGALTDDIENGLKTISDQAKQALKESPPTDPAIADHLQKMTNVSDQYTAAKTNYAQTKELMNDPFIIKLLKQNPEDFLNHAVKAQDIANVGKLKTILGPDNFAPVQQNLLANMLVNKEGELSPTTFVNKVDKIGYPTLTKVFDPSTLTEIVNSQKVFKNMYGMEKLVGNPSGTSGILMAKQALFGVPTTALGYLMGGAWGAAASTVAAPVISIIAARMYLSSAMRDLLIHGVSAPNSAAMALSVMAKGTAMTATRIPTSNTSAVPLNPSTQPTATGGTE